MPMVTYPKHSRRLTKALEGRVVSMQLLFCSRNVSPMGCARALSRPDKRKEMFTAFSKTASSKLKEFDKKLETNLNGELKVCRSSESPIFDVSKPSVPPPESFEKPVGRKETLGTREEGRQVRHSNVPCIQDESAFDYKH